MRAEGIVRKCSSTSPVSPGEYQEFSTNCLPHGKQKRGARSALAFLFQRHIVLSLPQLSPTRGGQSGTFLLLFKKKHCYQFISSLSPLCTCFAARQGDVVVGTHAKRKGMRETDVRERKSTRARVKMSRARECERERKGRGEEGVVFPADPRQAGRRASPALASTHLSSYSVEMSQTYFDRHNLFRNYVDHACCPPRERIPGNTVR